MWTPSKRPLSSRRTGPAHAWEGAASLSADGRGMGPHSGQTRPRVGASNRRRLPRSAVTLAPCWRHSSSFSVRIEQMQFGTAHITYADPSYTSRTVPWYCALRSAPRGRRASVQASRGRALTESRLSRLRKRGKFHCRCVVCACSAGTVGSFSNKPLSPKYLCQNPRTWRKFEIAPTTFWRPTALWRRPVCSH